MEISFCCNARLLEMFLSDPFIEEKQKKETFDMIAQGIKSEGFFSLISLSFLDDGVRK